MTSTKNSVKAPPKKLRKKKASTHLYFQEKSLTIFPKLLPSKDTVVLYLYSNNITKMECINSLVNLTSLYLQNNQISKMENMENLRKLKRLYIGQNNISVLEGLSNMECLEELHVEKQLLAEGAVLCVDPRTILAIAGTLKILNISGNNLSSLEYLSPLRNLRSINASNNDLDDIKEVCQTIREWYYLQEASFVGNAFTRNRHYRETVIGNTYQLVFRSTYLRISEGNQNILCYKAAPLVTEIWKQSKWAHVKKGLCKTILDDKYIADVTRTFIKRFEQEKLVKKSKLSINISDMVPGIPQNYPAPLQKAVSASILKGSKCKLSEDLSTFDEKDAVYIPWNALPVPAKRRPFVKVPRHYKQIEEYEKNSMRVNTLTKLN